MKWLRRFLGRSPHQSIAGRSYQVTSTLYSFDGNRSAELREFDTGQTYILEAERVENAEFTVRHGGALVGPFASPKAAERFIVSTSWFAGDDT